MRPLRFLMSLIILGSIMVLAACGTNDNKEEATNTGGDTPAEDTSYTVEHAMGTTEIKGDPETGSHFDK